MPQPSPDVDDPVVDFGAHFHTDAFDSLRALHDVIGPVSEDAEAYLDWLAAGGIDAAVLSQPYFMGHHDAAAVARANDNLLDVIDRCDEYFGLAGIPVGAGRRAAAAEFERSLDNGYNGGALPTKVNGAELDDAAFEPIFEVAERRGAPIMVHPKLHDSVHADALDDDYLLNAVYGREVALSESISKVIHGGILDRYPGLNLVYHHLGGNIASMMGRVRLQLDPGRWPGRQENVKGFSEFRAQLEDRIYVDTSGFLGDVAPLLAASRTFPPSQILFATDAPYEPRSKAELERQVTTVTDSFPRESSRAVLGGNALDVLVNV